jgi:hypothetical protein
VYREGKLYPRYNLMCSIIIAYS